MIRIQPSRKRGEFKKEAKGLSTAKSARKLARQKFTPLGARGQLRGEELRAAHRRDSLKSGFWSSVSRRETRFLSPGQSLITSVCASDDATPTTKNHFSRRF